MRDDGRVSGDDLLRAAADELYAADLDSFTERRKELAAGARAAGEPAVAKEIAALRKPTRSAWAVNRLVRADPTVPERLATLAGDLRAAEAALDGHRIRELSQARRELVDALVRQALDMTGESAPPAALQDAYSPHPVSLHVFFRLRPPTGAMGRMWNTRMSQPMTRSGPATMTMD